MEMKKEEIDIDFSEETFIPVNLEVKLAKKEKTNKKTEKEEENILVSPLINKRVSIKFIPKQGKITNPKHVLYGGMSENSYRVFVTPRLLSGHFVNVLTDSEKEYLENIMGLEYNALSVYKKTNNFWEDDSETGISSVTLYKKDNYLDLSNPEDFIKYKILLANKDAIAPSLQVLQDFPKATYQFVIVSEDEETDQAVSNMSTTMKCYKEYGKIESDKDTLRMLIETIDGRPTAPGSKLSFLQTRVNTMIQADPKLFLKVITDPLLSTKVLLKKCIDLGIIAMKGKGLYLREDNTPLCDFGEDPTLSVAARWINHPKRQDLLFSLQSKANKE